MRIDEEGPADPQGRDAVKIRPRIFLEGNFFVDLSPGSPSAPVIDDGDTIPINQTSAPVQLDQILTSLQAPTRKDLQDAARRALAPASDERRRRLQPLDPATGSRPTATARSSPTPSRASTSTTSRATCKSAGEVAEALDRDPAAAARTSSPTSTPPPARSPASRAARATRSRELPRTLRAGTAGAGRAQRRRSRTCAGSSPTCARPPAPRARRIDASLPLVRQLRAAGLPARAARPGRRPAPDGPVAGEAQRPHARRSTSRSAPASSCQNEQILPWTHDKIEDPVFPAVGPVYVESTKPLGGLAGESRTGDANGQWFRVLLDRRPVRLPRARRQHPAVDRAAAGRQPAAARTAAPGRSSPTCPARPRRRRTCARSRRRSPAERRITVDDPAGYQKVVDRARKADCEAQHRPSNLPKADRGHPSTPRWRRSASDRDPQAPHATSSRSSCCWSSRWASRSTSCTTSGCASRGRGRALPPQGRVLHRAGRHAGPGPDGPRLGRARRRHRQDRAQGRRGHRHDGPRPRVQGPRPHRRDRAAAAQDRPEGHVHRAATRVRPTRRWPRRTGRSRSRTRCPTSTPTRSTPFLDTDTRDYLKLLVNGAGRGPERPRQATCRRSSGASSRPTATWPGSPPRSPSATATCAA